MRYNYEANNTLSINAGKTISLNPVLGLTVTPFVGLVIGDMNGGNLGSNLSLELNSLFFSAESQYTFSVSENNENFFYNWSELGCQFNDYLYAGLALQYTRPYELKNTWEPGLMLGFTLKNWTFPLYAFNPITTTRNFVLGINWEWNAKD